MPIHDWTQVDMGVFHDFHNVWMALLRVAMNSGLLPEGFYAMTEQHAGKYIADVLTLHGPPLSQTPTISGGTALAETVPKVRHHASLAPAAQARRKTLTIRHVSGHRIIALLEIVSPSNKDRKKHVDEFLDKLEDALAHGIHLVVVDLFPPSKYDRLGLHAALLERLGGEAVAPPADEPLTVSSYVADAPVDCYWEYVTFGGTLPEMPLFLDPEIYVKTPLEGTYQAAWQSTPRPWREMLE